MLSRNDIERALANGHLKIFPFEKKNLTGIGYNLSTTDFAFSVTRGILLTVHQKTVEHAVMRYVVIPAQDTVLFFSREYIEVDETLAGTFHSKVSNVSQGLGHISTTLDPTWKGQLLISINNPTAKDIIFDLDKSGGNIMTMLLHELDAPVTGENIHDNNKGRCELLISHFADSPSAPKYRNKHLELKEFVQKELADSLNGYDNFLDHDPPQDRYVQKIDQLAALRDRLMRERNIITEGRYELGKDGKYLCMKNPAEMSLIKDCVLYEYKSELHEMVPETHKTVLESEMEQPVNALPMIDGCIEIIAYELSMIEHIRRIQWQNKRVSLFAGEDSELVQMRRSKDRKKRIMRFLLPLLGIAAVTGVFFWILITKLDAFSEGSNVGIAWATLYAPFFAWMVQAWWKYWHN